MLMALEWELPKNIFAHGWWTVDGEKMSKSLGNVVDPAKMAEKYSVDAFRYFIFREVSFGLDGDFSEEALARRINTDLANDIGNLLSRTLTMIDKYRDGEVPAPVDGKDRDSLGKKIKAWFDNTSADGLSVTYDNFLGQLQFHHALTQIWKIISEINEYIASSVPWKEKDEDILSNILYTLAESLRIIAVYLYPYMPDTANNIWKQLGIDKEISNFTIDVIGQWGKLQPGMKVQKGEPLFPRIDLKKKFKKEKTMEEKPKQKEQKEKSGDNLITINDFAKVQLKIGKIFEAVRVEGSDKLIKLQVDTGENRQIVAGIGKSYAPEELDGKSIVVVTNLKPAKLMGVESQGMLLAATDSSGELSILVPEKEVKQGAQIR
jgi:methionyl-tRNA synthetase